MCMQCTSMVGIHAHPINHCTYTYLCINCICTISNTWKKKTNKQTLRFHYILVEKNQNVVGGARNKCTCSCDRILWGSLKPPDSIVIKSCMLKSRSSNCFSFVLEANWGRDSINVAHIAFVSNHTCYPFHPYPSVMSAGPFGLPYIYCPNTLLLWTVIEER